MIHSLGTKHHTFVTAGRRLVFFSVDWQLVSASYLSYFIMKTDLESYIMSENGMGIVTAVMFIPGAPNTVVKLLRAQVLLGHLSKKSNTMRSGAS